MADSVVDGTNPALVAGNTAENLAGADRDAVASTVITDTPETVVDVVGQTNSEEVDAILDEENTFDVSRKEFEELKEAFIRLTGRITKYNEGASHKI